MAITTPGDPLEALGEPLHALARRLLRRERANHTLQPTALVHEAFLRLRGLADRGSSQPVLLSLFARGMRRVLVDHARRRRARSRAEAAAAGSAAGPAAGSPAAHGHDPRSSTVLDLDAALRTLAAQAPRQAAVVELKFFGGLAVAEIAACLGVTERTVVRDWALARLALHRSLEEGTDGA